MTLFQNLLTKISKKMVITFSIVLTIFLLIYWFQIRPSQIKADCQKESDDYYHKVFNLWDTDKDGLIQPDSIDWISKNAKRKYESCLHRNGL